MADPHVTLENFTSAGSHNMNPWIDATWAAYDRSREMLLKAEKFFVTSGGGAQNARVAAAFKRYFGDPIQAAVQVDGRWNVFLNGEHVLPPIPGISSGIASRRDAVEMVLRRVSGFFVARHPVAFSLCGPRACPDLGADVEREADVALTRIYLYGAFFENPTPEGDDLRACTLISVLTWVLAHADDHTDLREDCLTLATTSPGQALTNASSYAHFVLEAFG